MTDVEQEATRFLDFLIGFGYMHDAKHAPMYRLDSYLGKSGVQAIKKSINTSGAGIRCPTEWVRIIANKAGTDNVFGKSARAFLGRMEQENANFDSNG